MEGNLKELERNMLEREREREVFRKLQKNVLRNKMKR